MRSTDDAGTSGEKHETGEVRETDGAGGVETQTFEEFVDGCLPALCRYAYALTGDRHAGEDLVQETLVRLLGAWRRIRINGNPVGYARSAMFRTYVSRWRTLRRRPTCASLDDETPALGDGYAAADTRDALRQALHDLPRLQRAVLVLTYLDDLPDATIADLLGRRPATVRSLRMRGLAAMRRRMAGSDGPAESVEVCNGTR